MVAERDPKFYNELKQLNDDLIKFLKTTHEKSPYFDLCPTLNDYIRQFNDLTKQYPAGNPPPPKFGDNSSKINSTITTTTTTAPTFGSTNNRPLFLFGSQTNQNNTSTTSAQPAAPLFSFSGAKKEEDAIKNNSFGTTTNHASKLHDNSSATTTTTATPFGSTANRPPPFLFGSQANQVTTSTTGTQPFFAFSLAKKEEDATKKNSVEASNNGADTNDNEDDEPPPQPQLDKYEEPDARHSVRCKIYEKCKKPTGDYVTSMLGMGQLYVKNMDTPTKLQVIIRQEPDLRRVLLNEVITPSIPLKQTPKAVQMVYPGVGGENRIFLAKVKDEKDASELFELLNSVKNVSS